MTIARPVAGSPSPADRLLDWYDANRRRLPWRSAPGEAADPYRVWLSEIMLQQTTVAAVAGYYQDFLALWPTVQDLAAADLDQVLTAWAGLGYYARARNLHKCARAVVARHGGRFPDTEDALGTLPGIGAYTAAAIAAIAFGRRAAVMDGNVERVVARLFAIETPLPGAKPALRSALESLLGTRRHGDFAQAMMDLGATVCTPRAPKCMLCPWTDLCAGRRLGVADRLPAKTPKAKKSTRRALAFWLADRSGAVLLRRRPESGLLGGMMEVPSSPWLEQPMPGMAAVAKHAPAPAAWRLTDGLVRHTFTHFHFELRVAVAVTDTPETVADGLWAPVERLGDHALPTVMRKIAKHALGAV